MTYPRPQSRKAASQAAGLSLHPAPSRGPALGFGHPGHPRLFVREGVPRASAMAHDRQLRMARKEVHLWVVVVFFFPQTRKGGPEPWRVIPRTL